MGRWGLIDRELLQALDEDPELVRMVERLAAENAETPNELLAGWCARSSSRSSTRRSRARPVRALKRLRERAGLTGCRSGREADLEPGGL
jgi:hypothetical protein